MGRVTRPRLQVRGGVRSSWAVRAAARPGQGPGVRGAPIDEGDAMLIRRAPRFTASEITDPKLYLSRRELISGTVAALVLRPGQSAGATPHGQPLSATRNARFSLNESAAKFAHGTTYNNFYEFGVNKDDPSRLGGTLR